MKIRTFFVALLAVASAFQISWALAATPGQMVVVYRSGHSRTFALNANTSSQVTALGQCSSDSSIAFVFTATGTSCTSAAGAACMQSFPRSSTTNSIDINVSLTCSNLASGFATVKFGSATNPPVGDYSVQSSVATLDFASGTPAPITVGVSVKDHNVTTDETFSVIDLGGSYQGSDHSSKSFIGVINAGAATIVAVTITGAFPPPPTQTPNVDPIVIPVAKVVNTICTPPTTDPKNCEAVASANKAAVNASLSPMAQQEAAAASQTNYIRLSPSTTVAQNTNQAVASQLGNLVSRIMALQNGGGSGLSTAGLTLADGGMPLSLAGLGDVLNAADSSDNEEKRTLLGGTRWGTWISGQLGGGTATRHDGNSGFDFDSWAVTGGADYRFSDRFFLGAAVGYSYLKSSLTDGQLGKVNGDTWSLHGYGGYTVTPELNLDGSLSWLHTTFDQRREIQTQQVDVVGDQVKITDLPAVLASGSTSSNLGAASIGATWTLRSGDWLLAPQAQYEFIRSDLGAFQESGDSPFVVSYGKQHNVTRSLSAGANLEVTAVNSVGTFRPYTRLLLYSDSGTGVRNLLASYINGGSPLPIAGLVIIEPDRSYGTVELGMAFSRPIGTRTVDFNISAMQLLWFTALDRWGVRLDMRVPF